jgi:glycosyltransferase involved in cell wall biosynthesis
VTDTLVILPTYNEAENIKLIVPMLLELPLDLGIVIVDDNSPDKTGDIADTFAVEYPDRVFVIHREGKLGLGTAYLAGFKLALTQGSARMMTMDADFSHHPRYIPDIIAKSKEGYDLVIGSRYVPGGDTPDFPVHRRLLSWGANSFARTILGLKAKDATAGFRCYKQDVLDSLPLDTIFSNGYSFLIEMLFLVQRAGYLVGEVPIIFRDREFGKSKISEQEITKALYTVLRLFVRRVLGRDPKFFQEHTPS